MCPVYWAKSHQSCSTLCDPIDSSRLPRPWDSPGKNTGVGCRFLLQCMKVKSEREVTQSCPTLRDTMDCSLPGSSVHGFSRQEYWSGVPLPSPKEISSLSHSVVSLCFFALIAEEGFLISPHQSLELCIQMGVFQISCSYFV